MADSSHPTQETPKPRTWRLASVRALMVLVAAAAGLLWGWDATKRRIAVARMVRLLPGGVLVSDSGNDDRIGRDANRAALFEAVRRIKELHAEPIAVSALASTLRGNLPVHEPHSSPSAMRHFLCTKAAIAALLWLGPEARPAVPQLIRTLKEAREPLVRTYAAYALARIGADDPAIISVLIDVLNHPQVARAQAAIIIENAANALGLLGPKAKAAIPSLIRALEHPDLNVQRSAIIALGRIGPAAREAKPILIGKLEDPIPGIRRVAIISLIEIDGDDPALLAVLEPATQDGDPGVRAEAERGLRIVHHSMAVARRREERLRLIAEDRAHPGPRTKRREVSIE